MRWTGVCRELIVFRPLCLPRHLSCFVVGMTRDNPYPNARHRIEDWDPAVKSEGNKDQPEPKHNASETLDLVPSRPRDSEPAEARDFQKGERRSSGGVEREHEPDSQSNF